MDFSENSSSNDRGRPDTSGPDQPIDPERLKKVEKLKRAVADGTYYVSAEDLARKLIDHMLQPKLEPNE
jgi:anti-sigma28 factor (negative regulator of flagellin synthesis)